MDGELHLKSCEEEIIEQLKLIVWGRNVAEEVFLRWTQGFKFSETEPSALIQYSGGPCAVIAPIQAYIIKNIVFQKEVASLDKLQATDKSNAMQHLSAALYDILIQACENEECSLVIHSQSLESAQTSAETTDSGETDNKRPKLLSCDSFHKKLKYATCKTTDLSEILRKHYINYVINDFGVLSFLYSVILTKGLDKIQSQLEDPVEPLIHSVHGFGGQCLINLLLTGEASPHVFDGEQDAGGMKLHGISQQAQIGFLTLLESHRLLEVGWYLKSPSYPIWVLGNETHLTVLFSADPKISQENQHEEACRIFRSYDPEGNGFISAPLLSDVMAALNLVSEPPEYVELIKTKLDAEDLGVILVGNFMDEFFPRNESVSTQGFELKHYNGIKRSNDSNKIEYHTATAVLKDFLEPTSTEAKVDTSQMLRCLRTKWPTIELKWHNEIVPSLN